MFSYPLSSTSRTGRSDSFPDHLQKKEPPSPPPLFSSLLALAFLRSHSSSEFHCMRIYFGGPWTRGTIFYHLDFSDTIPCSFVRNAPWLLLLWLMIPELKSILSERMKELQMFIFCKLYIFSGLLFSSLALSHPRMERGSGNGSMLYCVLPSVSCLQIADTPSHPLSSW